MRVLLRIAISLLLTTLACRGGSNSAQPQLDTDTAPAVEVRETATQLEVGSPMPGDPFIAVSPTDLTSQMRNKDIVLSIGFSSSASAELLSKLRERVAVHNASREIGLEVAELPESAGDQARNVRRLLVVLAESMSSEWHELVLDLTDLHVQAMGNIRPIGNSRYMVRMHPDSAPVIRQVQVCHAQPFDGVVEVFLDFSEPIDFVPRPSNTSNGPVEVYLEEVKCGLLPSAAEQESGDYIATLQFRCNQVKELRSLEVVFLRDLRTAAGLPVTTYSSGSPSSLSFDFSLAFGDDECLYFHGQ